MKNEKIFTIWTSDPDYEDWRDDLEDEYPDLSTKERKEIMDSINLSYLSDERANLNIAPAGKIIVLADIGRWNGRNHGYAIIKSGNISDCLYSECEFVTWYVDEDEDFRCRATHHDGTNYYRYRFLKDIDEDEYDNFLEKIYLGTVTETDIERCTDKIGPEINKIYGRKTKNG